MSSNQSSGFFFILLQIDVGAFVLLDQMRFEVALEFRPVAAALHLADVLGLLAALVLLMELQRLHVLVPPITHVAHVRVTLRGDLHEAVHVNVA